MCIRDSLIVFPIHCHGNHWVLAVINLRDKRFEYYDSLRGPAGPVLANLRRWLEDEHVDKKGGATFDTSAFGEEQWQSGTPRQHNGSDCGWGPCVAVTLHEWRSVIKSLRNLPAVFDYSGGNEGYDSLGGYLLNGRNLAQNLYDAAKAVDPGRPVMTVDGI